MKKILKLAIKPLFLGILSGMVFSLLLIIGVAFLFTSVFNLVAPDVNVLLSHHSAESSKIYSRDGQLLYEVYKTAKRTPVPLDKIAETLRQATVAIEDKNFYEHKGVSLSSLIRSAVLDYFLKDAAYGGSTITQQLVKNSLLTPEKSFARKVSEIFWAFEIENKLSKEQILELYLNQISYGRNAYGAEAAARSYFGKSAADLTLEESAYLAALPQAPSLYNPNGPNRQLLDSRKNYILKLVWLQGFISQDQYQKAVDAVVEFKPAVATIKAPHFVMWLKQNLISQYGAKTVEEGGLKIYTTLDMRLQDLAEKTVEAGAKENEKKYNGHNAALVALDPKTGQILAMAGSRDYFAAPQPAGCMPGKNCLFEANTNVAVALRQPGSSFKPYVYITAFGPDYGFTPATIVNDSARNFSQKGAPPYVPHNYNGSQYGRIPVRKALAGSLNIAAVSTAASIGTGNIIKTAHAMGITAPLSNCGLSLALGSCEVSLLDHTAGFSVIANGGKRNPVTPILKIENAEGKTIAAYKQTNQQVVDAQAAYEIISIITDDKSREFIFGPKTPLTLPDRIVAAKTGTTQDWKDGWTVGFTPSLVAGVWVGNNDGTVLRANSDGVIVAAPIWHNFMAEALVGTPAETFPVPPGIQEVLVNPSTGKPVTPDSGYKKKEIFSDYALARALAPPAGQAVLPKEEAVSLQPEEAEPPKPKPAALITSPQIYSTITSSPFSVNVSVDNATPGTRVELLIDGSFVADKNSPPYTFDVWDEYKNGPHTLTVRAINSNGTGPNYSVPIEISLTPVYKENPIPEGVIWSTNN